jgi:aldehyde dehydrogenase
MQYAIPGSKDALFTFQKRFENFIGGEWEAPKEGLYFENVTLVSHDINPLNFF